MKKHTPWFIELKDSDFGSLEPDSIIGHSRRAAIFELYNIKKLCEDCNIWYKQQTKNLTKNNTVMFLRLYFKSEEDMNTIKLMR